MNESNNLFDGLGQGGGDLFNFDLGSVGAVTDPFGSTTPPAPEPETTSPAAEAQNTGAMPVPQPAESPVMTAEEGRPSNEGKITAFPMHKAEKQPSSETAQPGQTDNTDGQEGNILLAGMAQAEEKEQQKKVQGLSNALPVFSYNGCEEEITNLDMTFEELREEKSEDFLELEEASKVTWDVSYGGVRKTVPKPRKDKIGDFKREIESSKAFVDALKKGKDKKPKCIIKPTIRMEKKGIAAYRGIFSHLEDARNSEKAICIIPSRDGKVFEMRRNQMGEFLTPSGHIRDLDEIRPGFVPALPPIPYRVFEQIVSLFRRMMFRQENGGPVEALAQVFWDRQEERYFVNVPRQKVSQNRVQAELDNDELFDEERYIHYADIHSHNVMRAKFSPVDDADERANRVYIVVGRLDQYYPDISVRICNGGVFLPICPETVLEPRPMAEVPETWLDHITPLYSRPLRQAA